MKKIFLSSLVLLGLGMFVLFSNRGAMAANTTPQATGQSSSLNNLIQALQSKSTNGTNTNAGSAALDAKLKQLQEQMSSTKPADAASSSTPSAQAATTAPAATETPAVTPTTNPALTQNQANQLLAAQQATAQTQTTQNKTSWQLRLVSIMYLVTIFLTWLFLFYGFLALRAWMISMKRVR